MQPGKPPRKLRALFRKKKTDGDTGSAPTPKSSAKPLTLGKMLQMAGVLGGTVLLLVVALAVLTPANRPARATTPPPYAAPAPSTAAPVVVTPENTQPPQATSTPPLAVAPSPAARQNPPEATQTPEESPKPVPAPTRKRNPFGNPEAPVQETAKKEGKSTPPPSLPSMTSLNPPPPAPTPALPVPSALLPPVPPPSPMRTEPVMPDVKCLAVLEGNRPSAVVLYRGTEMVIENGGSIPTLGKLIRVQNHGCEFAIGKRRLVVTLSGERKWK